MNKHIIVGILSGLLAATSSAFAALSSGVNLHTPPHWKVAHTANDTNMGINVLELIPSDETLENFSK
ncbi:MAG: hypothetical protein KIT27_12355, partial [Legionellales bacterium]|nr:hypothetical protein [Legionellales bacterium]